MCSHLLCHCFTQKSEFVGANLMCVWMLNAVIYQISWLGKDCLSLHLLSLHTHHHCCLHACLAFVPGLQYFALLPHPHSPEGKRWYCKAKFFHSEDIITSCQSLTSLCQSPDIIICCMSHNYYTSLHWSIDKQMLSKKLTISKEKAEIIILLVVHNK